MSQLLKRIGEMVRPYLVVNAEHVDAHDVLNARTYRRASATLEKVMSSDQQSPTYKTGTNPYGKLANNYYFKRDLRRSFPQTVVMKNPDFASVNDGQVKALPSSTEGAATGEFNETVLPGKEVKLNYSSYPSEYETITYFK
ncbi:hypothetical protein MIR68_009035 [Amoeboaphelidium protococcarum]|nr:hypothetical protein MIR68_009035 [Amoeboaphelidium protococcarum]KAI3648734.1 hypothetical protein MP228_006588 [Amoeboaphelidium protococcarum]